MVTAGLAQPRYLVTASIEKHPDSDQGPWAVPDPAPSEFRLNPFEAGLAYNSSYPSSFNTGGIWQGRGATGWAESSASMDWLWFSARLGVQAWASQNQDFALGPSGLANQPLANLNGQWIDTPQRFGTSSFGVLNLAGSELRAEWGPVLLSFSDQNLTFGPAVFNPLLLSSQAQGVPHVRLGLNQYETPVGKVEAQLVYGKLTTSAYWDPSAGPSDRFFGALFLGYQPNFFPELTLGAGRTIISNWSSLDWHPPVALFGTDATGTSGQLGTGSSHQHVSLTYQLRFPAVGFETYGEWGKNDYSGLGSLYWINPDHMQAYTLGVRKTFELPWHGVLGLGSELTILSQSKESLINGNGYGPAGDFYSGWAPSFAAGYTNNGMVLGGGIGNGSEAQYYYADAYFPQWHFGLELRRWANDVTWLYLPPLVNVAYRETSNDVEIRLTLKADYRWTQWMFSGEASPAIDLNRYHAQNAQDPSFRFVLRTTYTFQ